MVGLSIETARQCSSRASASLLLPSGPAQMNTSSPNPLAALAIFHA
jgi:hypothetical protein